MNKGFIVLVLLIIAVVGVSGCITPKEESTPQTAFVGGSGGLSISFMQNAPPSEYPECTGFEIGVQLENKGEYTLEKGKTSISISGIATHATGYYITPSATQAADELTGRQKFGKTVTPGGQQLVSFSSIGSPDFPGDTTQTIIATICYPYRTVAMSTICVKESFTKQTTGGTELCKITGDKTVFNAGSPVHISSLSQFPVGSPIRGITVNMKLSNVGGGTPYALGATCPAVLQSNIGKIKVTKMHLINLDKDGDCVGKIITMTGSEAFLSCKFDWTGEKISGEFEDILEMAFDYGYTDTTTTKVKFLNVPGQNCAESRGASATATITNKGVCPDSTSQAVLDAAGGCAAITEAQYPNIWSKCNCGV